MTDKECGQLDMNNPMDEAMLARVAKALEDAARAELTVEEHRAVQAAMRRAQGGSLSAQEQLIRHLPAEQLAVELRRRGWTVTEP